MSSSPPPGWYPDPGGSPGQRWWDGGSWTHTLTGASAAPTAPPVSGPWQHVPANPQRGSATVGIESKRAPRILLIGVGVAYVGLFIAADVTKNGFLLIPALVLSLAFRLARGRVRPVYLILSLVLIVIVIASAFAAHANN